MTNTERRLKAYLKKSKCSQTDLARDLGVSKSYVCHLLAGRRQPSLSVAARLEELTGIPMRQFARAA